MSAAGVAALRVDREEVLALAADLRPEEWAAPSACAGWRVQDVVVHLANTFRAVADPSALLAGVAGDLEATQAAQVEAKRHWSVEQIVADYKEISARGLNAIERYQDPARACRMIPIEDAGTYPLHLVANALEFDHFCHLRNDILRPYGPIDRPGPSADELHVGATLEYLIAGLPQMSHDLAEVLRQPFGLTLTGPGGGKWTLELSDNGEITVLEGALADTHVASSATDFIIWSTKRRAWCELDVEIVGQREYAISVLEAIHLF